MKLIKPSIKFMWMTKNPLQNIELAGRTCYKSEDKITNESSAKFVQKLINRKHFAMIEHASVSYRVICDRGVTHEIVRHRLFSYAQESTRYCNYKSGATFIIPPWLYGIIGCCPNVGYMTTTHITDDKVVEGIIANKWLRHLQSSECVYQDLLQKHKWTPQQARSVLPNALKTEIVITGNLREWRHFFKLRCAKTAHPQMQEIANMILGDIMKKIPIVFDNIVE